jgi:hypothetical protein
LRPHGTRCLPRAGSERVFVAGAPGLQPANPDRPRDGRGAKSQSLACHWFRGLTWPSPVATPAGFAPQAVEDPGNFGLQSEALRILARCFSHRQQRVVSTDQILDRAHCSQRDSAFWPQVLIAVSLAAMRRAARRCGPFRVTNDSVSPACSSYTDQDGETPTEDRMFVPDQGMLKCEDGRQTRHGQPETNA